MSHERASTSATDETSLFLDVMREAPLSGNRQPRSILGALIYCFLLASYAAVSIAAPWIFFYMPRLIPALICSCNVLLLVITVVFQQYWIFQVRKVRLQGYYTFSQKLKHIARLPFVTVSCGNALMLLALVWESYQQVVSLSLMLRIAAVAEALCAGCFMSLYIGCIHKYNSLNGQPDILRSLYTALQPSSALEDLRYYDSGSLSDQQMALLQYQRENLHYLSEEVLRLQDCLSKYQRSYDGNTPQVDLAHLLASRDQELRALSAEMDQVQSELRLARGLIAERDSEIMRIRATNNQYVEENERLRGILGEWSARAAKLERALEAERSSNAELRKNLSSKGQ
ncbi:FRIGIDA interacting protein 1 [Rhynchospora pubera]|uniref:FRIGIDA interacting protein 1 n=1 Tax=Rhynchospora pubera TaxID=906938 RepID=A0AAV8FMB8_9POAL|nr:FRIGIDA interacting protein 1 [Rhynchospora pubera]KAJ4792750.1 FRIGIDA interacting protein 1 [Rhynchospora pubera]